MEFARTVLDWLTNASSRRQWRLRWIAIIVLPYIAILVLAILTLTPRKEYVISTGTKGGVYHELGLQLEKRLNAPKRYFNWQHYSARVSDGDYENVEAIERGDAQIAFATDGLPTKTDKLRAVLPVSTAYMHVAIPLDADGQAKYKNVNSLIGARIYAGSADSGTRAVTVQLLEHYGIRDQVDFQDEDRSFVDAADDLINGRLDAVFMLTTLRAPAVAKIAHKGGFTLMPIARAKGLESAYQYMQAASIPLGTYEGKTDFPSVDVSTISCRQLLVCSSDLSVSDVYTIASAAAHEMRELANRFPLNASFKNPGGDGAISYPWHDGAVYFSDGAAPPPPTYRVAYGFIAVLLTHGMGLFYYVRTYKGLAKERSLLRHVDEIHNRFQADDRLNPARYSEELDAVDHMALIAYKDAQLSSESYSRYKTYAGDFREIIEDHAATEQSNTPPGDEKPAAQDKENSLQPA